MADVARELADVRQELADLRRSNALLRELLERQLQLISEENSRLRLHVSELYAVLVPYRQLLGRLTGLAGWRFLSHLLARARRSAPPVLGELRRGRSFGQALSVAHFPADRQFLVSGIAVQLATYRRMNRCQVTLALYQAPGDSEPLRSVAVPVDDAVDNGFHLFPLDPLPLEPARSYYFHLTSPDGSLGNAITAYCVKDGAGLRVDGRPQHGSLRYRLRFIQSWGEEVVSPVASDGNAEGSNSIVGVLDHPTANRPAAFKNNVPVSGWAVSPHGIRRVEALVDGSRRGYVSYGALATDVAAAHAGYPQVEYSRFVGTVPVDDLADGDHTLVIRVADLLGQQRDLSAPFRVDSTAQREGGLPDITGQYQQWLHKHSLDQADLTKLRNEAARLRYEPTISLVVPVYNTPAQAFQMMLASVKGQVYRNWELCLANDGSIAPHVRPMLARAAEADPRIRVVHLPRNGGIAAASNAALELASGEFVGLLDHDDTLAPHALFEVAHLLNEAPETDLIYSDEDKITDAGVHFEPFFKPDWSPDLLLSMNYISHFGVYRRALLQELGGFRSEFDGSQDYDLLLRFSERTDRIRHIPDVLYSWRSIPGSGARERKAKPHALGAAQRALAAALERRGVQGTVEPGVIASHWRVRYPLDGRPAVTVVLPSGGKMPYLEPCLESLLTRTAYPNFQVLLLDNSQGTAVADHYSALRSQYPNLTYLSFPLKPFNFPAINNYAVQFVETPYLLFLNDDITIITPDWIEAMLEHAQRPEVGIVGAKLLYPNGTIQHAGAIMGIYENTGHAFKHYPEDHPGYHYLPQVIRNYSAVTFACAMMRRSVYDEVGGLDEVNLRVAFNDTDLCLKVRERGYWIVYTPHAVLYHHESVTKKEIFAPGEAEYMRRHWGNVIQHDPFYNPNLTRKGEDYSLNLD